MKIFISKKIHTIIITLSLFSSGLFISCDDLLDTVSPASVRSEIIFDTPQRIEGLVNGIYKSLKSGQLYSGRLLLNNDLRGEEFKLNTENALTGGYIWANNFNNLTVEVNDVWGELYVVINHANILIEGLTNSTGVISDELKKNYIAEARFLRGLAYFQLVTIYGRPFIEDNGESKAVPLRLAAEKTSANNDLERSKVTDIYKQIIDDLNFAESNLPTGYSSGLLNTTRAHKNTAIALKTRVYLNQENFPKVIEEAQKIAPQLLAPFSAETGVKHALQPDITTIFSSNYTTTESIFSFPFTASDLPSGSPLSLVYFTAPNFILNDESGIIANNTWSATDKRRSFVKHDAAQNRYLLAKYQKTNPAIDYIPVIRYAEVLLNYAEAEARDGQLSKSILLLNAVRHRSDASYVFPATALLPNEILNTIRIERRIELLGEGFRANDILRDLLTFPTKPTAASLSALEATPDKDNYIFPTPNNEILTNKLINK